MEVNPALSAAQMAVNVSIIDGPSQADYEDLFLLQEALMFIFTVLSYNTLRASVLSPCLFSDKAFSVRFQL